MARSEPKSEIEARLERLDRRSELAAAFILSIAALLSSYAGFQASLWDGEQAGHYTMAEQSRTNAARSDTVAGEVRILDMMLFIQWAQAFASGDARLQAFYRSRFRPEFARAFEDWLATRPRLNPQAPSTPFAMPSYRLRIDEQRRRLHEEAERHFAAGESANDHSDRFLRATVVLAMSLFMGGIVQAFKIPWLRVTLLGVAALCCLVGLVQILALPALRLT